MTTQPPSAEALTKLLREFMANVRAHFAAIAHNSEPQLLVDRVFAALAAGRGLISNVR